MDELNKTITDLELVEQHCKEYDNSVKQLKHTAHTVFPCESASKHVCNGIDELVSTGTSLDSLQQYMTEQRQLFMCEAKDLPDERTIEN